MHFIFHIHQYRDLHRHCIVLCIILFPINFKQQEVSKCYRMFQIYKIMPLGVGSTDCLCHVSWRSTLLWVYTIHNCISTDFPGPVWNVICGNLTARIWTRKNITLILYSKAVPRLALNVYLLKECKPAFKYTRVPFNRTRWDRGHFGWTGKYVLLCIFISKIARHIKHVIRNKHKRFVVVYTMK